MVATNNSPVFYEVQRFSQRWFWVMFALVMFAILGVFAHGLINQLIYNIPWGERPMPDMVLLIVAIIVFLFCAVLIYIFYNLRLETTVYENRIELNFSPVWRKAIYFAEIDECKARTYSPLKEYGGWGIKYGFKNGWAYNIMGNQGVQLVLNNGKRILIGSQRASSLADTINTKRAAS